MRKTFIVIVILGLFVSCEKSSNTQNASDGKKTIDSLTLQKENKAEEIENLNSELDSLRRLSDSLKAISSK